ncbi:unnamed protein product [Cunninghamella blakesleeana]
MEKTATSDSDIEQQKKIDHAPSVVVDTGANNKKLSEGVQKIEAVSSSLSRPHLAFLLFGIFLVAYAYSLDGKTRSVYQSHATDSFKKHSLISTINLVRSVSAAAIQPPLSKAANVFGRIELISFAVLLYIVGTAVEASAKDVQTYAGGQVLFTVGMRSFQLLFEVLLADLSSLRNRVLFSFIPGLPSLINTWVAGDVTSAILASSSWGWGIGMWAIIVPAASIPIFISLILSTRKAKKEGKLDNIQSIYTGKNIFQNIAILFWRLDIIGILLLAAMLSLLLIPLTIAGGVGSRWANADVISMIVIGFAIIPVFVVWESKFAKYPCIPFHLLKNRVVLTCIFIGIFNHVCGYMQGDYLYTVLLVSFNESPKSATRIISLNSFASMLTGVIAGFIVRYVRRIKWCAVVGSIIYSLGLGLMIKYRSALDNGYAGVIGAQLVLGIGGGLIPYPVQAHIQTETKHEHVAIITAIFLTSRHVGSALGNAISGAIWTNTLPNGMVDNFQSIANGTELAHAAYNSPLTFIKGYPIGTPERTAMIAAYDNTQKILTITGCALSVLVIIAAVTLSNPVLGDEKFLVTAEQDAESVSHDDSDSDKDEKKMKH